MARSLSLLRREWQLVVGFVGLLILTCAAGGGNLRDSERRAAAPRPRVQKMCEVDGACHERAAEATPRTEYSGQPQRWRPVHAANRKRAAAYAPAGRPLVFYGDSITEEWAGTSYGEPTARAAGAPALLRSKFADWDPLVLAISGDQTQHLLWRLAHGELPAAAANATFVVHIGTNNLGNGHLPGEAARGCRAVVDFLLERTRGRVVVLALLPRGDGPRRLPKLCPPRCDARGEPFASFAPAVTKANAALAADLPRSDRVELVDCGSRLTDADGRVDPALMPDLLHPNVAGLARVADCLLAGSAFLKSR